MPTITRKQFVSEFAKGEINVSALSGELKTKLSAKGVSTDALKAIAGADGRISGTKEAEALFKLVDGFDKNDAPGVMETTGGNGAPTASGELYEELKAEVERNRTSAKNQGVVHLGMRPGSTAEAQALEKVSPADKGGVVRIEAYKSDGKLDYDGKSFDLTTASGLAQFRDALVAGPDKMPQAQARALTDTLARHPSRAARDELAQLGLTLFRAGEGKAPVSRLVLSGHGSPTGGIIGDSGNQYFMLEDVEKLTAVFPEGAKKMEHVAIASCFGASDQAFKTLQRAFPNLKSAFAYNEFAPAADGRAPGDLKKWAKMTSGDPSQVDPTIQKTATWNSADGLKGLPTASLEDMEKRQEALEPAYTAYVTGGKDKKLGKNDARLNEYYLRLADLVRNPDISAARKREVSARLSEVLRLRHPELQ